MGVFYKRSCPMCNRPLNKWKLGSVLRYECKNQCYGYYKFIDGKTVYQIQIRIFGERFDIKSFNSKLKITETFNLHKDITARIRYYQENDRYLMKLLELNGKHVLWSNF